MNDKASKFEKLKELKKDWIDWHLWRLEGYSDFEYLVKTNEALNKIFDSNVLTDDDIQRAIDEAYEEMSKVCNPGLWNLFINGSKEHWDMLSNLSCDNPQ